MNKGGRRKALRGNGKIFDPAKPFRLLAPILCFSFKMNLDDGLTYQLFKTLEEAPTLSQRALSRSLGISLGKINYCLKALIDMGWVKVRNFENSSNKMAYAYFLTPAGFEAKAKVTVRFLRRKIEEYEKLQQEIQELQKEITK